MAKKNAKKQVELKEVSRKEVNGVVIITFEDGSVQIIPAPIKLTAEEAAEIFGSEEEEEDEEEEDEEEELTGETLAEMDFEDLEDLCDDKDLETDPDDFEEEDVEKLRKAVAKELGITIPKASKSKKNSKK